MNKLFNSISEAFIESFTVILSVAGILFVSFIFCTVIALVLQFIIESAISCDLSFWVYFAPVFFIGLISRLD